ncbi:MAG: hypothetical protein M3277_08025 [Actinomycetota bacterium]|nr:hypothetical protein [Actinomycetota bacterium]
MDAGVAASEEVARIVIAFGAILVVLEIFVPGGIAGFLGAAAVLLGLYLLDILSAPWAITTLIVFTGGLLAFAVPALRARRQKVQVGAESVIGLIGRARTDISPEGSVGLKGIIWQAKSGAPIAAGADVRVRAAEGLTLIVEPTEASPGFGDDEPVSE